MRSADRLRSLHSSPSALTKQLPQLGRTTHSRSAAAVAPLSSMAQQHRTAGPPTRLCGQIPHPTSPPVLIQTPNQIPTPRMV